MLVATAVPTQTGVKVEVSRTVEVFFRFRQAQEQTPVVRQQRNRVVGRLVTVRERQA